MGFVIDWALETWHLLAASAPWLLFGFAAAGLIAVVIPSGWILNHLGGSGMKSVVKASIFGIPLTLCSCSVIPVASSLRRRGASKGATAGFLISTPEIGVDSFALSYALLGPVIAIARPIAAFATTLMAGGLIEAFDGVRTGDDKMGILGSEGGCCSAGQAEAGPKRSVLEVFRYGYVSLLSDLAHWLALGFLLAGLVGVLIPDGFLARYIGDGLLAKGAMLVAGLPLYICATSSTPLAAALIAQGLSPGAALVFLLVGPATNAATMTVVSKELGVRSLVIYLVSIAVMAMLAGIGLDAAFGQVLLPESVFGHSGHHVPTWQGVAGLVFCGLMLNGLRVRWRGKGEIPPAPETVEGDSSDGHCPNCH